MESFINAVVKIIGSFLRKKPVLLNIDAFNDTWISLQNICGESFIIHSIEPSKKLMRFPIDFLVQPDSYFKIHSISCFTKNKTKKIRIKIKLLDGVKYSYSIKWENKAPHIR